VGGVFISLAGSETREAGSPYTWNRQVAMLPQSFALTKSDADSALQLLNLKMIQTDDFFLNFIWKKVKVKALPWARALLRILVFFCIPGYFAIKHFVALPA
jgi:hypothetical protein